LIKSYTNKFNNNLFFKILVAGLFFALSFPPVNFYFLIFFSFIILLDVIFQSNSLKQIISRTYKIFFVASLIAVSWIALSGMKEGADPFLILGGVFIILVYPLFFVIPSVLFFFIKESFSGKYHLLSLILFPFIWTGFEYVLSLSQISFPWLLAGNSQTYNLEKLQYIEFTGVYGVSFWVCSVSISLYIFTTNVVNKSFRFNSVKSISILFVIIALYFLPDFYNYFTDSKKVFTDNKSNGSIKVGIVQPNINPWKKWGSKQTDLINYYAENIKKIYNDNPDIKLIVLPETALPYYFREDIFEEKYLILKNLCDSINIPILIGTPDLQVYKDQSSAPSDSKIKRSSGIKYDTFNSAFLFEPGKDKNEFQFHNKIKLVIGSERMPYQEYLPFTKSLIEWGVGLSSWQMGKDTNVFSINSGEKNYKFITAICYESVYPGFFADFVNKGSEFSVIITNDGWWGKLFGTYQHNQYAVLRAVENRTWIVRCANTGISCFIDPYGNMYDKTEIDTDVNTTREIGLKKSKTFYTIHGDLFSQICFAIGILFFLLSFFFKTKIIKSDPTIPNP